MGKNRDRLSIVAAIVDAAEEGSSKTRIMYNANLSYKLLEKYLRLVLDLEFVQFNGVAYGVTGKGYDFLKKYRQLDERYDRTQKELEKLINERKKLANQCQQINKTKILSL